MSEKNRHTVMMEDTVWDWSDEFADEVGISRSKVINRAVKVYAGKMSRGEWKDRKYQDKYDKEIRDITGGK